MAIESAGGYRGFSVTIQCLVQRVYRKKVKLFGGNTDVSRHVTISLLSFGKCFGYVKSVIHSSNHVLEKLCGKLTVQAVLSIVVHYSVKYCILLLSHFFTKCFVLILIY